MRIRMIMVATIVVVVMCHFLFLTEKENLCISVTYCTSLLLSSPSSLFVCYPLCPLGTLSL